MKRIPRAVTNLAAGLVAALIMNGGTPASAALIADLAADFVPAGTLGQTSDVVGINGTLAGTWHYYQDPDTDPTNGNHLLLTWQTDADYENSESGYAGTNIQVGLPVPIISSDRLFDGPTPAPPLGSLMGHPSNANFLAVEYRAHAAGTVDGLSIDYRAEKPNSFGAANLTIVRSNGVTASTLLATTTVDGAIIPEGTLSGLGTLSPGESIWMYLGSGGAFEGDQMWAKMTINGSPNGVPEPSRILLLALGGGWVVIRRSRPRP